MINTYGKLLFTAFIALIIGIALIQTIGDNVELVKVGSITVLNETLTFTSVTTDIINETHAVSTGTNTTILIYDDLTAFTELRNETAIEVNGLCNVTLAIGTLICNGTNSSNLYADYTYISTRTDTLANDEIVSLDAVRNASAGSNDYVSACDFVSLSGVVNCTNPHDNSTGYADYKWEPDTYVHSSAARTILTLVILFFALGILAVGIGYAWKSFQEGKLF